MTGRFDFRQNSLRVRPPHDRKVPEFNLVGMGHMQADGRNRAGGRVAVLCVAARAMHRLIVGLRGTGMFRTRLEKAY